MPSLFRTVRTLCATSVWRTVRRVAVATVAAVLAAVVAGCVDTTQHITLNPDGSGKIDFRGTYLLSGESLMSPAEQKRRADDSARKLVQQVVARTKGIEAWRDLKYTVDDNRVTITAVLYFPDLNEVHITGGIDGRRYCPDVAIADGVMTVTMHDASDHVSEVATPEPPLTPKEVKAAAASLAELYSRQAKAIESGMDSLHVEYDITLPGTLGPMTNFSVAKSPHTVHLLYAGIPLRDATRAAVAADGFWEAQARAGRELGDVVMPYDAINGRMFGTVGPVRVATTGPLTPQFDYAAEMKQAKEGYAAMLTGLGLPYFDLPPVVYRGEALQHVSVGGAQWVTESDSDDGLRLFNEDNGLYLAVVIGFDDPVVDVSQVTIDSAVTDTGASILGDPFWFTMFGRVSYNNNRDRASFVTALNLPSANAQRLASLKGTLVYRVAQGEKRQEFGPMVLKPNAAVKPTGVTIDAVEDYGDDAREVELTCHLPAYLLKGLIVRDAKGREYVGEIKWATVNDGEDAADTSTKVQVSFDALPSMGTLIFVLYDNVKAWRAPWEVKDFPLQGRPQSTYDSLKLR